MGPKLSQNLPQPLGAGPGVFAKLQDLLRPETWAQVQRRLQRMPALAGLPADRTLSAAPTWQPTPARAATPYEQIQQRLGALAGLPADRILSAAPTTPIAPQPARVAGPVSMNPYEVALSQSAPAAAPAPQWRPILWPWLPPAAIDLMRQQPGLTLGEALARFWRQQFQQQRSAYGT